MKVAKKLQNTAGFKYDTARQKIGKTRVHDDRDHNEFRLMVYVRLQLSLDKHTLAHTHTHTHTSE